MWAIVLAAQMPWTANLPEKGVALDLLRPHPAVGTSSLTSGAAYLSGRFPVGRIAIRFEVPLAHLSSFGTKSTALGSPYVGIETNRTHGFSFEAGFRPAVAKEGEPATDVGYLTDITRSEAFLPHRGVIAARVNYRHRTSEGFTIKITSGPSLWATTTGGDPELVLHQYVALAYREPRWWAEFGFGGILMLTESGSFGDRTVYQLGGSLGLSLGHARPAVHMIVPLDSEISSVADVVIGLGVAFAID